MNRYRQRRRPSTRPRGGWCGHLLVGASVLYLASACLTVEEVADDESARLTACDGCHEAAGSGAIHYTHVNAHKFATAIACRACHPYDDEGFPAKHFNGTVDVTFADSPLASAKGSAPYFDGRQCFNVYCHGSTLRDGVNAQPIWRSETAEDRIHCGWCHGMPPRHLHPPNANCSDCHAKATRGGVLDLEYHLNGVIEFN